MGPDGIPDDSNADGITDYYPTLYYDGQGYSPTARHHQLGPESACERERGGLALLPPPQKLKTSRRVAPGTLKSYDVYAFPFIYPGMYSVPDPNRLSSPIGGLNLGWVHYISAEHDVGVSQPFPARPRRARPVSPQAATRRWCGFPTWRETMAGIDSVGGMGWTDPISFVSTHGNAQPLGLKPVQPDRWLLSLASPTFLQPGHDLRDRLLALSASTRRARPRASVAVYPNTASGPRSGKTT